MLGVAAAGAVFFLPQLIGPAQYQGGIAGGGTGVAFGGNSLDGDWGSDGEKGSEIVVRDHRTTTGSTSGETLGVISQGRTVIPSGAFSPGGRTVIPSAKAVRISSPRSGSVARSNSTDETSAPGKDLQGRINIR